MSHSRRQIGSRSAVVVLSAMAVLLVSLGATTQPQEKPQQRPSNPDAAPAGNAENGKKLFNTIGCWQCHGYSAQGGSAGPRLVPNLMPFAAFTKYVRAPGGEMPPYTIKVVSEAQLADIYAFLKTIPPPRELKDIPFLNKQD